MSIEWARCTNFEVKFGHILKEESTLLIVDNAKNEYQYSFKDNVLTVSKDVIPEGIEYLDFIEQSFRTQAGSDGYYVIADCDGHGSYLCSFIERKNAEKIYKQNLMPIFGVKKGDECTLIISEGFKYELSLVFGIRDGEYYIYPRFYLYGRKPYEDISFRFIEMPSDSGYSEMAVAYRNYKLKNGDCETLKEKSERRKELKYAMDAPEIRIRLGWKETPPKILEQTEENEPQVKVACDFNRVFDIIDELKAQKVEKAQLCLVGWNVGGHDGRYPDVFPVEKALGGEERLRELIRYAEKNGYQIVCHTNSTDCYSISKRFSEDIVVKNHDGSLSVNPISWSGGRMYHLCPVKAYEYAMEDLPKIRELGFKGLHYIDVITTVRLRNCYDENHLSNSKQTLEIYEKIMKLCHDEFGGFASEGVFDFGVKYLDYGLYTVFSIVEEELLDENIPFWEIVYHGIILYNPMTDTVNFSIKEKKNELRLIERGGKPTFYFYSKHIDGAENTDWLGREDLICDTDEQLRYSVSRIKEGLEAYADYKELQTEFIEKHEKIDSDVYVTTYSNGVKVCCDYSKGTVTMQSKNV